MRVPPGVSSVDDLSGDYRPPPLGSRGAVQERIREVLPDVDWSDPAWGRLDGQAWSMELNAGRESIVDSLMLHVRGGGDDAVEAVVAIADAIGARALDVSTGRLLSPGDTEGWRAWQRYRDYAVRARTEPDEGTPA